MQKLIRLIIGILLLMVLSACGSMVYTVNDKNGNAKPGFRQGYTSMKDWDTFRLEQEANNNLLFIEKKIGEALRNQDDAKFRYWTNKKALLSGQGRNSRYQELFTVKLKIKNSYDNPVVIEDGPFRGYVLDVGETTNIALPFEIGSNSFRASSTDGRGRYRTFTIKRIISKKTKIIILKKVRM